ncbi:E3 ubiquitin-protein ligase RNF128 isoform X1 [Eublepharis macularius]|uniref:E3 ubiquitin-protein ligase RNF128 isoform X1 n=1 Tax=Eublepharis macularius TaxID=481883 RepID=A0AA97K938_EUBMA|nr:E3 ubiquitin-protein ligase RNF128 isoform X1 [Eublepharis macularius]
MRAASPTALLAALGALAWLGPPPGRSPAMGASAQAIWTAWLNVSYKMPGRNETIRTVGESGVFGQDSPLRRASGPVVAPDGLGGLDACSPLTNFSRAPAASSWLALIQRGGGCTFAEKIRLAAERGASAAVIYNYAGGTGNDVQPMTHPGTGDTVAIMISYIKGREILHRMGDGFQVTMVIEVGKKHGSWMNSYSIFFVSVSFFIVTAATVGYFIFYSARRLRLARAQNRRQRQLKADAKKAIGRLQLRTLKQGDKETGPDGDNCAVCIEVYKPNDVVRILTCNHLFHKSCIDPWLLEHRTCPMCKCDILKALGIEVDIEDGVESFPAAVSNEVSNIPSLNEEDNHSETASSGYASVQGTDEPALEEPAPSESDNLRLVNNTSQLPAVDVVPHLDNPGFEADETQARDAKS